MAAFARCSSTTSAVAFVASGLPTTRPSSFSVLDDLSCVFSPSAAPQPNLLGFCTIATVSPANSTAVVEPSLESWNGELPCDFPTVASPSPSSSIITTVSLRSSASSTSLASFASTEPSALFDSSASDFDASFASSFSSASSSAASIRSHCSSTLEADDSIFLTAVQRNIAAFAHVDKPAFAAILCSPSHSPAPPALLLPATFEYRASSTYYSSERLAWLEARPAWRY